MSQDAKQFEKMPDPEVTADIIIVGAGLSGLVTAWRCLDLNPDFRVIMIEASGVVGGDHTWSFNLTDVPEHLRDWVRPFIAHQWHDYDVKFPKRERRLKIPYCTGNSDTLRTCIAPYISSGRLEIRLNTHVAQMDEGRVTVDNGPDLSAPYVFDARGFKPNEDVFLGYQKFVGHVIKTKMPHGMTRPVIMDATVPQLGGYRFVYCLPYSDTEMLVEDTYYTDGDGLKSQEVDARIKDYIRDNLGVSDYKVIRREKGVLPITLAAEKDVHAPNAIGIRGGFYHAVTGYSFPDALRVADNIAQTLSAPARDEHDKTARVPHLSKWHGERFLRLLNRMLFRAAKPEQRYTVLQRFYGLPQGLIERFYAGELTRRDKLRILIGKPPVPVTKALYNFSEKAFIKRERACAKYLDK